MSEIKKFSVAGSTLRAARERVELRPTDAARKMGITPQHLHAIESGKQRCPLDVFVSMAVCYGVERVLDLAQPSENNLQAV